jgi:hypothetical protein
VQKAGAPVRPHEKAVAEEQLVDVDALNKLRRI